MKLNRNVLSFYKDGWLKKYFLIMKLTWAFILILNLQMSASVWSQTTRISVTLKNSTLQELFTKIEKSSEYRFFYNNDEVDVNQRISIDAEDKTIGAILETVLKGLPYSFKESENKLIVIERTGAVTNPSGTNVQQGKKVSGKVTDSTGGSLPGVSVVVKGTTTGIVTDVDGKFTLSIPVEAKILVFSFVGMKSQEFVISGKALFNVIMEEGTIGLEEVVAIGYGSVKKSDLTGSVGSITGELITQKNTTQISTALQGALSGVMVTRNGNEPGSSATIRIRGITTIGDNDPLIILDGVPINNINDVNPTDVETISVLKDAASASIYGSRAAAGVILVTTKRAKSGDFTVDYNYELGYEKPTEMSEYAHAVRYMQMVNEIRWNDNNNFPGGEYPIYTKDVVDNYATLNAENPDLYPDTDWMNTILEEKAPRQSHILTIRAGSNKVNTRASFAYDEIGGLYIGKNYKRMTARINNDITISKNWSVSIDIYGKRSKSENPVVDPGTHIRMMAPIYAAVWSNGLVAEGKSGGNMYGQLKYGGFNQDCYNQVGGKISMNFTPIDGLVFSAVIAPEFRFDQGKIFQKKVPYTDFDNPNVYVGTLQWNATNNLTETRNESHHTTTQFLINYSKSLGNHNLNSMAGYEDYYAYGELLNASSSQMELASYPYLDLGNPNFLVNGGNASENAYRSYFGRIIYNYNKKYLLQGNIRYDGSSRFASEYRWGIFPSFSAGWVISEEPFLKNFSKLSHLKVRASWGTLGNERIGNYPYQSTIGFSNALFYQGNEIVSTKTAAQWTLPIKDISWEKTESYNLGADVNFFSNKLHISGDYYIKETKDMLLELEIPDYIGYNNPNQNTGKMHTNGWEIEVGWKNQIGALKYSISANLSDFKSIMGDLGGIEFLGNQVKFKGSEFNEWYGYKSEGLYQKTEDVTNTAVLNSIVTAGDIKYTDISGPDGVPDGIISADYDRVLLGGSLPRYMYGSNINLEFKNFDLSIAIQGVGKRNVELTSNMVQPFLNAYGNMPLLIDGEYWSAYNTESQNLTAKYPRLTYANISNNYAFSDYWLFNGAYLRLKNVTLGYNIPKSICKILSLSGVRIYGSVTDLFSINNYPKGWDPEISNSGYPMTASSIFGISVKF